MHTDCELSKQCDSCNAFVPAKSKICEFCDFEFKERVLTEREANYPFAEIITGINNAFFRLSSFMNGSAPEYEIFGFKNVFDVFFIRAKSHQNYTYETCKLIGDYWNLTEQIRVDIDKGDYENVLAFENEDFQYDINSILYINDKWGHRFCEFATEDEIERQEKKFTIFDIINKTKTTHPSSITIPPSIILDNFMAVLSIFEQMHFVIQGGKGIDLDKYSLKLYNDINNLKKGIKYYYLTADIDVFTQFCVKALKELKDTRAGLVMPSEFGIRMEFEGANYTIEPELVSGYINTTKRYLQELIDFVARYLDGYNDKNIDNTDSHVKGHQKYSLRHVALIYFYNHQLITKGVIADKIARNYGYKSGDKLYQYFLFYSERPRRINIIEGANIDTKLNNKIKLFQEVIETGMLTPTGQAQAIDELKVLKRSIE